MTIQALNIPLTDEEKALVEQHLDTVTLVSHADNDPDLEQELYLSVMKSVQTFKKDQNAALRTWIIGNLKHARLRYFELQKQQRRHKDAILPMLVRQFIEGPKKARDEAIQELEMQEWLANSKLSSADVVLLHFRHWNGWTLEQIATQIGMTHQTVQNYLTRIYEQLRRQLSQNDITSVDEFIS